MTAAAREEVSGEAPPLRRDERSANDDATSAARLPSQEGGSGAADQMEPSEATSSPVSSYETKGPASERVAPAAPSSVEPSAQQFDPADQSLVAQRSRSVRSLLTYVGLAVALVVTLGSVAVFTRSAESEDSASSPASESPDPSKAAQRARALDPDTPRDEPAQPKADTREGRALEPATPEPDTSGSPASAASSPEPEADTNRDAGVAAESSSPAPPAGPVTVTIHTTPPQAIIFDETQRIGKGVARIIVKPGRKRSMLALLDLHHPRHFVLDGSQTTVNITLERMDANAIASSIAAQKRKAAHRPAATKRATP